MCVCFVFFFLSLCMLQEDSNLFSIPRAQHSVCTHRSLCCMNEFNFGETYSFAHHRLITSFREHHSQIPSCLFRGLQCHFSWNNFDEYLLINHELIFFIYKHLNPLCEELLTSLRLGDKKGASPVVGLRAFHHIQVLFPQGFSLSSLEKCCFLGEPHKNKLQI